MTDCQQTDTAKATRTSYPRSSGSTESLAAMAAGQVCRPRRHTMMTWETTLDSTERRFHVCWRRPKMTIVIRIQDVQQPDKTDSGTQNTGNNTNFTQLLN